MPQALAQDVANLVVAGPALLASGVLALRGSLRARVVWLAVAIVGVQMIKGRTFLHALAPALVVFLILTGVPILVTPLVQLVIGQAPGWVVCVPIGVLTLYLIGLLIRLLSTIAPAGPRPGSV